MTVPPPHGHSPSALRRPGAPSHGAACSTEKLLRWRAGGRGSWEGTLTGREVLRAAGCGLGLSEHLAPGRGRPRPECGGRRAHLCCPTQETRPQQPTKSLNGHLGTGRARPPGSPDTCTLPGSPCDLRLVFPDLSTPGFPCCGRSSHSS